MISVVLFKYMGAFMIDVLAPFPRPDDFLSRSRPRSFSLFRAPISFFRAFFLIFAFAEVYLSKTSRPLPLSPSTFSEIDDF